MSLKVLLADDSMTAQNMAKKILADSGYEVTTVSNGAAAVKKIAEVKPDLVILDIYMPGYTGLEVCERVRANLETSNMPVLLTVGKMEPYRAEDGARVRADGIIVKPFEATDLINIVKKISDKFAPNKAANYGEIEPAASAAEPVAEFPEPAYEDESAAKRVEIPAEMAAAPAMVFDEAPAVAAVAPALEWAHPVAAAEPEALEFPAALPVEPAEPAATPISFVPAHAEPEAGVITDSMPAYAEPELPAPSFELEPIKAEVASAADTEIEFNALPQPKEIVVERSADLEPTINTEAISVTSGHDPALVTEPEELSNFVTNFGVENAEEIPVGTVTGDEPFLANPSVQEMPEPLAPEHVFPTASLENMEVVAEPQEEEHKIELEFAHPEPAAEAVEAHGEPAPAAATESLDDFEARVAAAMSAFDQPLGDSLQTESEPAVEQVDNFIGDPEIVNPAAVEVEPVPDLEIAVPAPAPEPRRALDVNETMVLPAEALLSLEAEMRKALEQKQAEMSPDEPAPTHLQVMDDFAPQAKVEQGPADESGPAVASDDDEFAKAVAARLREIQPEPEPTMAVEALHEAAPMAAATAAASAAEQISGVGDQTLALAVKKAVERLQPQLIAEIMKALKGE